MRSSKVTALIYLFLLMHSIKADAREREARTFKFSTEPEKAILFVSVAVPQVALARSMTLYGDGRLVLMRYGSERKILEEHVLNLTPERIEELLEIAVTHDLPTYDDSEIQAKQLRGKVSSSLGGHYGADGEIVFINIALESYAGESSPPAAVFTKIRLEAAKSAAAAYPDIPEFHGINLLVEQFYYFWNDAGGSRW